MSNILIMGATSAIAQETAKLYANSGNKFFLVALEDDLLRTVADDLSVRGAGAVEYRTLDVLNYDKHEDIINAAWENLGEVDIVLIAHGVLGKQHEDENDFKKIEFILNVNFMSCISILTIMAGKFEKQKTGSIAVISSVAGDRGRKNNYVYGASKGGLSIFLDGLRGRLAQSNVNVITIKPGFVDTPMTQEYEKGLLWSKPETIAKCIKAAIDKRKGVAYVPKFWYWIMFIIRHIPEKIFKKLNF
ncbi:MAG: SDR family oxidoreductase [candidate division Zixibacteria bacterium]